MNETTTIVLEVELAGELLSGSARAGGRAVRQFTGRLGLMGAIEELLASEDGWNAERGANDPERRLHPNHEIGARR